jgi:hydroxymethylglutaryl-CoA reductase (NADPH)
MAEQRRRFAEQRTRGSLSHVGYYSIDPASLRGNVENFMGVAQVPIGLAGPLRIVGEQARGDFYVPWRRRKEPWSPATTGACAS